MNDNAHELIRFLVPRAVVAIFAAVLLYITLAVFGVVDATPPACREYTGPLVGMDYDGEMWTYNGRLVGFAREEDTRIWDHPDCV